MLRSSATRTNIDRDTFTITFERTFRAGPEQVFEAWTQPEHLRAWWDPTGTPLVRCTVDLRPGGAFEFVNQDHGPPFAGVYQTVERPSLLVFDALGAIGTVRLEGGEGGTHMTVSIRCPNAQHFEQFLQIGVHEGTGRTLDNLVEYVAKRPG